MPEVNISDSELTCSNETVITGLWMWKSRMLEDDISISFSFSQQQPHSSEETTLIVTESS